MYALTAKDEFLMYLLQAELPNSQSSKITQPLRALKSRQHSMQLGQGPSDGGPGASPRLCALLNDLRELRTKQGELTSALKACVPPVWWGIDAGFKSQLGDRFKMCQVFLHSLDTPSKKPPQKNGYQNG